MTEITRRNIFAAAGDVNTCDRTVKMLGPGYNCGMPAETPKEDEFDPAYVCAVYIRLEPNGTFTIRHAYDDAGDDPTQYDTKAIAILEDAKKAKSNDDWKDTSGDYKKRKEIGFDNFTFGSRQLIYFFVDNDPETLKFDERNGKATILRFSPYSGINYSAGPVMKENYAFYNLVAKDLSIQASKGTRAVVVQFWNTKADGTDIDAKENDPETHYVYSMNLHMLMSAGKRGGDANNRIVPVILDPDGGNVGSKP